jgi:hypothetical protein
MDTELARVRLWSRAAAIALAALMLLPLVTFAPAGRLGGVGLGPATIEAVTFRMESAARQPPPQRQPDPQFVTATPIAVSGAEAGGFEVRLWRYGAGGEIVFDDVEQYQRCLDARRSRRDSSDCPSAMETAELRYAAAERRGLNIERPQRSRRRS